MEKERTLVKVVIPVYKNRMEDWESVALQHNLAILSSYPVCFVYPEGLDVSLFSRLCPSAEFREVSPDWLGLRRGISGYNEMMMSKDFYDLFSDCEYILICHLDAWIFRDELAEWCRRGYDIVAAPWPVRPRYRHFPLRQYIWLKSTLAACCGRLSRVRMYGKIGNGGLCLRRVASFSRACEQYADVISQFNARSDGMHNEDIFWALIPKEFRYPTVETALEFAYDLKPRLCHELNRYRLPMGCHGFLHKSRRAFWAQYIPLCEDQVTGA